MEEKTYCFPLSPFFVYILFYLDVLNKVTSFKKTGLLVLSVVYIKVFLHQRNQTFLRSLLGLQCYRPSP